MTEQEILNGAPSAATHVDFEGDYWLMHSENSTETYMDGEWLYCNTQEPLRSLSDIQTIIDLRAENAELEKEKQLVVEQHDMWRQQWHELKDSLPSRDLEQQLKALKQYANTCGILREEPSTRSLHEFIMDLEDKALKEGDI